MITEQKFDAILPCRVTGTRLYGKPLQLLDIENRITILEYLVKYIEKSKYLNNIILAIAESNGNEGFIDLAEKNGWKYIYGNEIDMLGRMVKAAEQFGTKHIFQGSTESPYLFYNNIDDIFEEHVKDNYDLSKISELPEGSSWAFYKTDALKTSHKKGSSRHRSELVGSYIFDNQNEFKILDIQPEGKFRRSEVRITVDYPEDLVFCRQVYQALEGDKKLIEISDIIKFWDNNSVVRKPMEEIGIDWGHGRLWK